MKQLSTLFLLLFISLSSFSQVKNFNITLTIKGMENQIGILAYYYGDKRYIKDTLKFDTKGVASIKGKHDIPSGVYLVAIPSMGMRSFDIILKETDFSFSTDTINFIKNASIKNSVENKQMFEDMNFMLPLGVENDSLQKIFRTLKKGDSAYAGTMAKIEAISKKITAHRKEIIKKYPTTLYTKLLKVMFDVEVPPGARKPDGSLVDTFHAFHYTQAHYFDDIDFSDSGYIRSPVFQSKLTRYFENYTYPHPDSITKTIDQLVARAKVNAEMYQFVVNELFVKYAKSEIMGDDAIYVYMADKYYLNGGAWWADPKKLDELRARVEAVRPTLIGKTAPNFMVQDTLGKPQVFHDFALKNKYTLLVFWNSDCGHCQQEIPHLKRLYQDSLKAMGLRVFSVSTEQTDSSFRAFAAKNCSAEWVTCADMRGMSAFRREYDVISTPKIFITTPDLKIIAKNIPLNNLVDFLQFEDKISQRKNTPGENKN